MRNHHIYEQSVAGGEQTAYGTRYLSSLLLLSSVLASSVGLANPSVNGSVISWPDDGWYQVQTPDGATTLCGGGSSCTVIPGEYLVINHTLGIRYTDVQVGVAVSDGGLQVNGQVISWPDYGWFQVQSGDGSITYCNGGRSCTVEPGVYLVINHTTGQRFNNVVVGDAPALSDVTVKGHRISWPENGWYQVQTADGITSLCNGGSYCDVAPGTYLVINHTTGVRFTGIEVREDETGVGASAVINRDNHAELLAQVFSVYTGRIYDNKLPGMPLAFMQTHPSVAVDIPEEEQNQYRNETLVQYACDNGGVLDYLLSGGSYLETVNHFKWENCLDGNTMQNGWLISSTYEYGGYYRDLISSSYAADYANGDRVEIAGNYGDVSDSDSNPYIRRIERWISQGFDFSLHNESAELAIRDADTVTDHTWYEYNSDVFIALMKGSFQMSSPLSGYRNIDVATEESLYFDSNDNEISDYSDWNFSNGLLELTAEDGSALRLEADSGNLQTAEITLLQDGVELETFQQPWSLWRNELVNVQKDPRTLQ